MVASITRARQLNKGGPTGRIADRDKTAAFLYLVRICTLRLGWLCVLALVTSAFWDKKWRLVLKPIKQQQAKMQSRPSIARYTAHYTSVLRWGFQSIWKGLFHAIQHALRRNHLQGLISTRFAPVSSSPKTVLLPTLMRFRNSPRFIRRNICAS
ncbi:uncharacterized protein UV8b_01369 [Ustilaginoidea virens]|uniref:Uncharacterized protein n=1 Tax=Ustilaginoidea virens TaxID=1159556 RepID=A0A8E5HKV8_USTVR|nr:uncharacterized protein UV8b_01369 [Ustilaginoidea virens]QUC17128.1 hypothetical protein UV8b_01369 [Ustilaginoidea virens]